MERKIVSTPDAPQAIGPYSQAVKANGFVFVSGQIAIDPATGQVIAGDVAVQTERVCKNLAAILTAAATSLDRAVKTTVYLKDMGDFTRMNDVYAKFFTGAPPARATVAAAGLPRNVLVEIDVVALA